MVWDEDVAAAPDPCGCAADAGCCGSSRNKGRAHERTCGGNGGGGVGSVPRLAAASICSKSRQSKTRSPGEDDDDVADNGVEDDDVDPVGAAAGGVAPE